MVLKGKMVTHVCEDSNCFCVVDLSAFRKTIGVSYLFRERIMRMLDIAVAGFRLLCLSHTRRLIMVGASFSLAVPSSSSFRSSSASLSSLPSSTSHPGVVVAGKEEEGETKKQQRVGITSTRSYRYAALDMDGTLLNDCHVLSETTKDVLRRLLADNQGFGILIATGRAISTVYEHLLDLNLDDGVILPVVSSNGAQGRLCTIARADHDGTMTTPSTTRTVQSTMLFSLSVPQTTVQRTIDRAKALGLVVQYYVDDDIYANPMQPQHDENANAPSWHMELCQEYTVLTGSKTIYVEDDFAAAMQQGLPSKLLVLCPKDIQDDVMAQLERAFSDDTTIIPPEDRPHLVRGYLGWFVEILPPNVNKGSGLARMCDHLNIALDDVVAFGDGDNDYEFIQRAGWGIVMKNGQPVVKEVADEVIGWTNNEHGVVRTLEAMEARNELAAAAATS
jgi:Cof subfamily protein (haloacid dehalogenase superfamily)